MKKSGKKIFITGATGYVGRHLAAALIEAGHIVHVLTRKESSVFSGNKDINVIVGDITDSITLPVGIETIYHCAGVIYHPDEMERVNVLGTQNIVNIALRNQCKLIHLSSAGVTGRTKEIMLDEETTCNPQNAYEISKYKAEQIVIQGIKNGLRAHILRPTTIFGAGKNTEKDSFFQLVKSMRNGYYRNIGNGVFNIVHIDEVVKAMELLDETSIPYGNIYLISNSIAYKKMDLVVKNVEPVIRKKIQTFPYPFASIGALILTLLCFMSNRKNPLTFSRLKALTSEKIYSQGKIVKILSFQNTLSVEEYIKKVCREYISLGLLS